MYPDMYYAMEEGMAAVSSIMAAMAFGNLFSFALSVTSYILMSLGLYTIAQRREINHPWMAWIPVLNLWILGSIADQYQYVVKNKVRSRRKVLIGVSIATAVCAVVMFGMLISLIVSLVMNGEALNYMSEYEVMNLVLPRLLGSLGVLGIMGILAIISTVFQYVALHDLYSSCDPANKTVFLVLSILFSVVMPFFVFACRKKDFGMPPRVQPAYQPIPQMQPPAEPWEQQGQ